jgi:uncharacterized protein (DUF488 family)
MPERPTAAALRFFTVGHSSHAPEHLLSLLTTHRIGVVVDTRSSPYSRFAPHFDREALKEALTTAHIRYLWMGDVVGGRPRDESCYDAEGRVLYSRVAAQEDFQAAIARLEKGAAEFRLALLCSEEDPAHCHRRLLVTRVLIERGATVVHIRGDGSLDSEAEVAAKSGKPLAGAQPALFAELDETRWRSTSVIGKKVARSVFE